MMKILVIGEAETSWLRYKNCFLLSPKIWDINISQGFCTYSQKGGETGGTKIDGVLWREGHEYSGTKILLKQIVDVGIPCANNPAVTLKCMDAASVMEESFNNDLLSKYCKYEIVRPDELESKVKFPCVLKLPDFHAGLGKWKISSDKELHKLLEDKQCIVWNGERLASGYLTRKPLISEKLVVEPFVAGKDLRIYTYLDRSINNYKMIGIERTLESGEWLANRHTASFKEVGIKSTLEEICLESAKLLGNPDLFAVDAIENDSNLTILEIHNDVPGLSALEKMHNYAIHDTLVKNLEILSSAI